MKVFGSIKNFILPTLFGVFVFLIFPLTPAMLNNTDKIPVKHIFWFSGMRALEISPIACACILITGGCIGAGTKALIGGKD